MKRYLVISILILSVAIKSKSQNTCLAFEANAFQCDPTQVNSYSSLLSARMLNCWGNFSGGTVEFALGRISSFGIGMGVTNINYEKQWQGIFPESNQFGMMNMKGRTQYWSFPLSYCIFNENNGFRRRRGCLRTDDNLIFGLNFSYIPSLQAHDTYEINTFGSADSSTFIDRISSNTQNFQQNLTIGVTSQLFLFDRMVRIAMEPYVGVGSGYFKDTGTKMKNYNYGVRFQFGFVFKGPRIRIVKEIYTGNYDEKKKELQQKQMEIQQQLHKPQ